MDNLLIGWRQIHEELFCTGNGKRLISFDTLYKKHGPGLKRSGAVFRWCRGKSRVHVVAGWRNVIQNYFIKLGQEEDAERQKAKLAKQNHMSEVTMKEIP